MLLTIAVTPLLPVAVGAVTAAAIGEAERAKTPAEKVAAVVDFLMSGGVGPLLRRATEKLPRRMR